MVQVKEIVAKKKLNLQWALLIGGVALLICLIAFRRPRSFDPTPLTPAAGSTSAVKPRAEVRLPL